MDPIPRNFDWFRLGHAKEMVDVSPDKIREWSKRTPGKDCKGTPPKIYRMNNDDMTWARYSEVEKFILENSTIVEAA